MVGRLLGGVFNMVGGLLGGGNQFARSAPAFHNDWMKHSWPGMKHSWPGGKVPPGHGGTPPGQVGKKGENDQGEDHTNVEVKKQIDDSFTPQQATPPVEIKPGAGHEQGPPDVTGKKGPAGTDPKISQFHPAGEDANYTNAEMNCGPAVGAMVARGMGYGKNMTDAQLIKDL